MSKTCYDALEEIIRRKQKMENVDSDITRSKDMDFTITVPLEALALTISKMSGNQIFDLIKAVDQTVESFEFSEMLYQYFKIIHEGSIAVDLGMSFECISNNIASFDSELLDDGIKQRIEKISNDIAQLAVDIDSHAIVTKLANELQDAATSEKI